jgi:ABC-type multidrug transport system fused ATPase/permease subunit
MRKLLKLAFLSHPSLAATTVVVSVAVALIEGAGLALILPIIEGLGEQELVQPEHPFSEFAFRVLTPLGIPFSTTALVLVGLALFSFQSFLLFVKTVTTIKVRIAVEVSIRKRLFAALMAAPVSYFDDQRLGRFSNAITVETTRAGTSVLQLLNALVALLLILAYLVTAVVISWQLSLAAMGFVGAFALVARRTGKLKERGERMTEANTALKTTTTDYLSAVREVSALGLAPHANHVFRQVARAVAHELVAIQTIIASFRSIYEIAAVIIIAALLAVGTRVLDVQTAAMVAFFVLLFRLAPRLILFQSSLYQYVSSAPGYGEIESLYSESEANRPPIQPDAKPAALADALELQGVTFSYDGQRNALDGLDLRVEQGTTIGIVGGSGAGKSTLVNLLLRFDDPTSGRVVVDGVDLREIDVDSWRAMIGFVGQESFLFHESIAHNLLLGNPRATDADIRAAAAQAGADAFIDELPDGYDTVVGDRGVMLSGGQRQRLALARALVRDPQVLLLDEATSDLDARSQAAIQESLKAMHGKRTVIVVAHRLSTIRDSDVIVVLEHGKIVETGDHDSLVRTGGHYAQYYATEAGE